MEWMRIEAKWHDMARRLQHETPSPRAETGSQIDAVSRPEHKGKQDLVVNERTETTLRARV